MINDQWMGCKMQTSLPLLSSLHFFIFVCKFVTALSLLLLLLLPVEQPSPRWWNLFLTFLFIFGLLEVWWFLLKLSICFLQSFGGKNRKTIWVVYYHGLTFWFWSITSVIIFGLLYQLWDVMILHTSVLFASVIWWH